MTMKKTVIGGTDVDTSVWQKAASNRQLSSEENQVKQFQEITFSIGNFDDEKRTFDAIASTPVQDRQGDSILQDGWFIDNFLKNPVIPWAHDYETPPVARAIEIGINAQGNLQFTYQAPPEGIYELADTVWNLYRNQFMFAFSVGFIPMDYEGDNRNGYTFTEAELLEISAVVVPANAQALALAYKGEYITEKQAKSLYGKMTRTIKNLEDVMKKNKTEKEKPNEESVQPADEVRTDGASDQAHQSPEAAVAKGALADALENEANFWDKWELYEPVDDIIWTFMDVWFGATASVDDWVPLLKEFAQLLMGVANGTYMPPSDDDDNMSDTDDDDWLFFGLKNGVDKDKIAEFAKAAREQYASLKAQGLTNEQKVKDNSNMTKSQEDVLKSLLELEEKEAADRAAFRKTLLETLKGDSADKTNVADEADAGKTAAGDKTDEVVPPVVDPPVEERVVEKEPVKTDETKQDDTVSNPGNDQPKAGQGDVKSAEDTDDGANHKDGEDDTIDPDKLTDEQQEEFIRAFNDELEKLETAPEKK